MQQKQKLQKLMCSDKITNIIHHMQLRRKNAKISRKPSAGRTKERLQKQKKQLELFVGPKFLSSIPAKRVGALVTQRPLACSVPAPQYFKDRFLKIPFELFLTFKFHIKHDDFP